MSLFTNLLPSLNRTPATAQTETAERTPSLKPVYEVTETPEAYTVTVELPGVAKEGLELTADDTEIRLVGRRAWARPEGWTALHRETADLPFELVLTHERALNVDQIAAELKDGVLRASLPKSEALKPRKIALN